MKINQMLSICITNTFIIIVLVMIALSLLYFINGSLEEFPTEEQHVNVRFAMAFVIFVLAVFEAVLLFIRKSIKQQINR